MNVTLSVGDVNPSGESVNPAGNDPADKENVIGLVPNIVVTCWV